MDAPTILTGCGIALIGLALGYAVCWFNEVSSRDREITELLNEKRNVESYFDRLIEARNRDRAELVNTKAELIALRAKAIIRDGKGHFVKASA